MPRAEKIARMVESSASRTDWEVGSPFAIVVPTFAPVSRNSSARGFWFLNASAIGALPRLILIRKCVEPEDAVSQVQSAALGVVDEFGRHGIEPLFFLGQPDFAQDGEVFGDQVG